MLILSQNRDVVVNMNNTHSLSVYMTDGKFVILAWFGTSENDFWRIGDYETEDRAKETIREIWQKYGEYLHRTGGPAIFRGTSAVDEAFWVLPKIYEMPEV